MTAGLEVRLEQATDHIKQVVQEAAVIAALSASSIITGALAVGVGLIALYRWTAEAEGAYAGLGVEGAILFVMTVILTTAAIIKGKSLSPNRIKLPCYAVGTARATSDPDVVMNASAVDASATKPHFGPDSFVPPTAATPPAPTASASDVVEPLAFFLSKVGKYPSVGNPIVDELIGNLRETAHGTADEAINRAANVIRHGARRDLVVVLTGTAFIGWLLTRHSRQ